MKLVVGLGNRGEKYEKTRHNVGFIVSDYLVCHVVPEQLDHTAPVWREKGELQSRLVKFPSFLVAQPLIPMNSSGLAVKQLVSYFKMELENLLVIHDDLDLELGSFKLQKGRGAAGHRGVASTIQALGSPDFWRLRVGIGRPPEGVSAEDYVLEKFGDEELGVFGKLIEMELVGTLTVWLGR